MAENTKIEWVDHTWNPWMGCTKVGPACDHCYAENMMDLRYGKVTWGAGEDRLRTSASNWNEPLRWDRAAAKAGKPTTVFCLSLGDIWDNEVDPAWRRAAFAVMERTPNLIYLLLSKRIGNAAKMCNPMTGNPPLPRNAAIGATMVTQDEWDRDMPKLRDAGALLGALFTFASVEPMLGAVNPHGLFPDWVIVGGESGPGARPMHPDWARSLRDQCTAAGVPYLFKQWGEFQPLGAIHHEDDSFMEAIINADEDRSEIIAGDGAIWRDGNGQPPGDAWMMERVGKKRAGRFLDGVEHNGFPEPRQ